MYICVCIYRKRLQHVCMYLFLLSPPTFLSLSVSLSPSLSVHTPRAQPLNLNDTNDYNMCVIVCVCACVYVCVDAICVRVSLYLCACVFVCVREYVCVSTHSRCQYPHKKWLRLVGSL